MPEWLKGGVFPRFFFIENLKIYTKKLGVESVERPREYIKISTLKSDPSLLNIALTTG
jgi:hypothetical protein